MILLSVVQPELFTVTLYSSTLIQNCEAALRRTFLKSGMGLEDLFKSEIAFPAEYSCKSCLSVCFLNPLEVCISHEVFLHSAFSMGYDWSVNNEASLGIS